MAGTTVTLPHGFVPRPYQLDFLRAMDAGRKRALLVWHRRAGKDKVCWNYLIREAALRPGTYFYMFPTYKQAKKAIWDARGKDGMAYRDHIPKEIVASVNETEMKVTLTTGSVIQLVGADTYDSLMSTNPVGVVLAEFSLQDPLGWKFLRPILLENGGWAVFNMTPRGKNHGWELYENAKHNPRWYVSRLTIEDTGVLTAADIADERRDGLDEDLIQQEYYCSFEGTHNGSYYGRLLSEAETAGRIGQVPVDPSLGVETWWDLGMGDATAIWFTQTYGAQVRLVDYYEAHGEGLDHYARVLQDRPYVYTGHWAPHDIEVRELGTGTSRKEIARQLGIDFRVVPRTSVDEGIAAVRALLPRCWFDARATAQGLRALSTYHKTYDEHTKSWSTRPVHDWTSHASDAFRYLAIGHRLAHRAPAAPNFSAVPASAFASGDSLWLGS